MRDKTQEAREYLESIEALEEKIRQKQEELAEMKLLALSTGGIDYSKDRVITSAAGDGMVKQVINYVEFEEKVEAEIREFIQAKDEVINQIHGLDNARRVEILYKRYVQYNKYPNIYNIADEMNYSYDHMRHLMSDALKAFGRKYL